MSLYPTSLEKNPNNLDIAILNLQLGGRGECINSSIKKKNPK